jgi:hypothetical protein
MKSEMERANTKQTNKVQRFFSFKREFIIYNMRNLQDHSKNKRIQHINKKIIKKKRFPIPKFDASQSLTLNGNCHPTFNVDSLQDAKDGCVRLMMANVANNVK